MFLNENIKNIKTSYYKTFYIVNVILLFMSEIRSIFS